MIDRSDYVICKINIGKEVSLYLCHKDDVSLKKNGFHITPVNREIGTVEFFENGRTVLAVSRQGSTLGITTEQIREAFFPSSTLEDHGFEERLVLSDADQVMLMITAEPAK